MRTVCSKLTRNLNFAGISRSISLAEANRGSNKQTDFTPKLSDFSHSCKAEDTADSPKISTPSHASPEQFTKVLPIMWCVPRSFIEPDIMTDAFKIAQSLV